MADLAVIKYIIKETKNVWRFIFEAPMYDKLDYKPGQLVNLFLKSPMDPMPHVRSYSIASYPDDSNTFELIITDQPGGKMSDWLFRNASEGAEIGYKGPMGIFTLPETIDRDLYFVCTGSGISPFRSMVNHIFRNNIETKNINLVFGCRTKKDLLYYDELKDLAEKHDKFNFYACLSREDKYGFHHGYVHDVYLPMIEEYPLHKQDNKPLFYLCGWRDMIDEARMHLGERDYKMKKDIKVEIFG